MNDIQRFLDEQQMTYLMVTLTKLRYTRRISRSTVAEQIGVSVQRITEFDERRTPWNTVTVWFLQQYARAIGVKLEVGFIKLEESNGDASDYPRADHSGAMHEHGDTG